MKLKNIYFISLALISGMFSGCADDTENFDNQLFMTSKTPTTFFVKAITQNATGEFSMSIPKPSEQDITFTIKADVSLVSVYEDTYYVSDMEMLPEGHYSFSATEGKIAAGALKSTPITVSFTELGSLDLNKTYVLPVTVVDASINVLGSSNTSYYVFKGAALINKVANINKNNVYVDWVNPNVVQNMKTMTAEALIHPYSFDNQLNTLMGIEGQFLFRFGDISIEKNQLQLAPAIIGGKKYFTTGETRYTAGKWHQVVCVYDGSSTAIYVDGKLDVRFSAGPGTINLNDDPMGFGGFWFGKSCGGRYLNGAISEARFWTKALTMNEIQGNACYVDPKTDGLLAYWRFNAVQDDGVTVRDETGNGFDAIAENKVFTWIENVKCPF